MFAKVATLIDRNLSLERKNLDIKGTTTKKKGLLQSLYFNRKSLQLL